MFYGRFSALYSQIKSKYMFSRSNSLPAHRRMKLSWERAHMTIGQINHQQMPPIIWQDTNYQSTKPKQWFRRTVCSFKHQQLNSHLPTELRLFENKNFPLFKHVKTQGNNTFEIGNEANKQNYNQNKPIALPPSMSKPGTNITESLPPSDLSPAQVGHFLSRLFRQKVPLHAFHSFRVWIPLASSPKYKQVEGPL